MSEPKVIYNSGDTPLEAQCRQYGGKCCCKCKSQIPINCNYGNQSIGVGTITDRLGWGCLGLRERENWDVVIFAESAHGSCELFVEKNK